MSSIKIKSLNLKTVISILLILFFGTIIILGSIKKSIFEGARNLNEEVNNQFKSFVDATKQINKGPGDDGHQQIGAASTQLVKEQQEKEQIIAEETRKKQREQNSPPMITQPVITPVTSPVTLIPQPKQSMPVISLTASPEVTTQSSASSSVEVYSF